MDDPFVKWINTYDPNAALHPQHLRAAWDAATAVSSGRIRYLERDRRSLMRMLKMCPCPECFNCICPAEANCVNSTDGTFCRCDDVFEQDG